MDKPIEYKKNLETPFYLPSHLESLKEKPDYFEVPYLETKVQRHDNLHYWLHQDRLQIKQFQYSFFQRSYSMKIQYHKLLWEQQDQNAYNNFPQVLSETELLPFIISNRTKHVHYRDLTSFNTNHLELINFDYHLIVEPSETSHKRRETTSKIISETSFEEYNVNILRHDTGQIKINTSIKMTIQNCLKIKNTNN